MTNKKKFIISLILVLSIITISFIYKNFNRNNDISEISEVSETSCNYENLDLTKKIMTAAGKNIYKNEESPTIIIAGIQKLSENSNVSQTCNGSIISKKNDVSLILTAAHCIDNDNNIIRVSNEKENYDDNSLFEGEVQAVFANLKGMKYIKGETENLSIEDDYAFLKVKGMGNRNINVIDFSDKKMNVGDFVSNCGSGIQKVNSDFSVDFDGNMRCGNQIIISIDEKSITTIPAIDNNISSQKGDSGSPLYDCSIGINGINHLKDCKVAAILSRVDQEAILPNNDLNYRAYYSRVNNNMQCMKELFENGKLE